MRLLCRAEAHLQRPFKLSWMDGWMDAWRGECVGATVYVCLQKHFAIVCQFVCVCICCGMAWGVHCNGHPTGRKRENDETVGRVAGWPVYALWHREGTHTNTQQVENMDIHEIQKLELWERFLPKLLINNKTNALSYHSLSLLFLVSLSVLFLHSLVFLSWPLSTHFTSFLVQPQQTHTPTLPFLSLLIMLSNWAETDIQ